MSIHGGMMEKMSRRSKSFGLRSDEDGAALVEFTVLMPLFFLILFGIVEFGSLLWLQNSMTNAAREGARTAAVQSQTLTSAQQVAAAKAAACRWLAGSGRTFTITATDCPSGAQDMKVDISISKAEASLMNTFFSFASGTLSATAWSGTLLASVTMRKENVCAATATASSCTCNTTGNSGTGC